MQIRHNLVVWEKPFFRRGSCVLKTAHHLKGSRKHRVFGMWLRIGAAMTGMAGCAVACALLWPHARDAGAVLAAQDDPAQLSELLTNSALRNSPDIVVQNVEAALAANDADLANSFVELAAAKNIALPEDLSRRVTEAVVEENSASHFAKRFSTGLLTGT